MAQVKENDVEDSCIQVFNSQNSLYHKSKLVWLEYYFFLLKLLLFIILHKNFVTDNQVNEEIV